MRAATRSHLVTIIAVVAHRRKVLGGGLDELRKILAERGYVDPLWYETSKGQEMSKLSRRAVADGADIIFVWGGDGSVRRCVDAVCGTDVELAILPAGTANVLAMNLQIPLDLEGAIDIGLTGEGRRVDVGVVNSQRFVVMAGVGFDAVLMHHTDAKRKDRFGRFAYLLTARRATRMNARTVRIKVDGKQWFYGVASCVLFGQVGTLPGGIEMFPRAEPDDGLIDIGVITASGPLQWVRVGLRALKGRTGESVFTQMTQGRCIDIKLDRATRYELDGNARKKVKTLRVRVEPLALRVRVAKSTDSYASRR